MLEEGIRNVTTSISLIVEGAAACVVAFAVGEAIWRLLAAMPLHSGKTRPQVAHDIKEEIRLRLGRWLAVALEMLLGADILRTAVAPTWSEIGKLAAIAGIRTALNFFLQREIDAAQARRAAMGDTQGTGDQFAKPGDGTTADRTRS